MGRVARAGLILAVIAAAGIAAGCSGSARWTWKRTTDRSGSCEVAAPRGWQPDQEFFLKVEPATTGPTADGPRRLPPRGLTLWGIDAADREKLPQVPAGKRYQIRALLVHGDAVCSVWRVKDSADFTADEKSLMQQVGKTLRWVR